MTAIELRTTLQSRISQLNELQLQELNRIIDKMTEPSKESLIKKRPFGLHKGSLKYMAEDFDAPLDDFKEYMPDQ